MRITISPTDNFVYFNGKGYVVDCSSVPNDISVIQWNTEKQKGHIEYINDVDVLPKNYKGNLKIINEDIQDYQPLIDAALLIKDQVDNPPLPPAPTARELENYATSMREKKMNKVDVPALGNVFVDNMALDFIQAIDLGLLTAPLKFRFTNKIANVTRAELITIVGAVMTAVQAGLVIEDQVHKDIRDGIITTREQIDAVFNP